MRRELIFRPSRITSGQSFTSIEGRVSSVARFSDSEFDSLIKDIYNWTLVYDDYKDAERYRKEAEALLDKKDNYSELKRVLEMAYSQAAEGKGKERHANGEKFEDQPIMTIAKGHGLGYQTGQAAKKLQEAHTLLKLRGKHAAIQEILGAINYAAAAVLLIEQMEDEGEKK